LSQRHQALPRTARAWHEPPGDLCHGHRYLLRLASVFSFARNPIGDDINANRVERGG
jgi:hypothetical protein